MKTSPLLLVLTWLLASSSQLVCAGTLHLVVGGDRHGYINTAGEYAMNPQFDEAASFTDGLAKVKISHKTGYVNTIGKYVWNPTN